ncbi:MAG: PAS domain-containing protein [Edaphobacter sp.]
MSESLTHVHSEAPRSGHGRREDDVRNEGFARLLSQITEGILCVNRNWIITFANEEARRRGRIDPSDIGGTRTLWEIYPHLAGTELERFYRKVMSTGEKGSMEYYSDRIDAWIDVSVYPTDEGIAFYYHDVTDRKGAEFLRDTSIRQLRQVLETTTDSVASIDRNWKITYLNRRAKELLSSKGELLGKNLWDEFPVAVQNEEIHRYLVRAMNEGVPSEFEAFYPDPLNLWLSMQCRPFEDGIVLFFRDITAERVSRRILLDQQATLAFVQQTARVATWEMDLVNRTVKFGKGSYPVYGRPFSELTTIDDLDRIIRPSDLIHVQQDAKRAIDTNTISIVDYEVFTPEGGTLWVECRRVPVYNSAGVATHLRGMTSDITRRKRNEQELATSEERYRVLADLNPQAIWMGAPDGSITYANQNFLDYIGFTIDELSGHAWLEAFYPGDRQRVLQAWTHSVTTGVDYDLEARMIRARDGHVRWWWLRAQTVRDDSGKILHWLGVALDIDDRKTFAETLQQRQEETERQRAELETIYQSAPIGLALFDPVEFRYLRINDRQCETLGLPREKILGRPITELAPLKGLREIFEQVAKGHPVRNLLLEGELPTRPGEHRYWNVSYSPVYNADGVVEAIAAVILEVTTQKKAEAALIQSEKLAAVGRLASSISHEINNPLEAITNLLYLVALSDDLPESARNYVQTAQSELSRVCQIATQTLRFHRQAVRATHISAADLVNAVLNLYQGRLSNSNIQVEAAYAPGTSILCFESDIRQVLNNLIANAIDAMRQGGGQLRVRAHNTTSYTSNPARARPGLRISIADTGHGMSRAVKARLFEPFYTTKDHNGTGLGLWISAGIVDRHHGRLTFRSSEHPLYHGTVFSLFIPRAEDAVPIVETR